jgi:hypothetical protein
MEVKRKRGIGSRRFGKGSKGEGEGGEGKGIENGVGKLNEVKIEVN